MKRFYDVLKPGLFPFSICILLILFISVYQLFQLPSPSELSTYIIHWFELYGYWVLFIAAFLEGVFIVGMYFPGSLAIALALYALGKSPLDFFIIGSISYFAFLASNVLNYYLGKWGYYRLLLLLGKKSLVDKMHNTMLKYGSATFFLTGIFPNFYAITSVCAGISNMKIKKIIILQSASLLFWISFWTIVGAFIIKRIDFQSDNQTVFLVIAIFTWGVFLVIRDRFKKPFIPQYKEK